MAQNKIKVVTEKGLAYEQMKDSYKRAVVLGAVTVGIGATFWFFSKRVNQSLKLTQNFVISVADVIGSLENNLARLGYQPSGLAQNIRNEAPRFDPTFEQFGRQGGLVGKLASVPIYTYIIAIGFGIMVYSMIRMERWFEPKQSFVPYKKE